MMRRLILSVLVLCTMPLMAQEHDHSAHLASTPEPQLVHETHAIDSVGIPIGSPEMQEAVHMNRKMHGDSINWLLMADRFEYAKDQQGVLQWEAQGWIGKDLDKLWFKTEGHHDTDTDSLESMELQLLYSRAIAPFWDLQAGWRHDTGNNASRDHAVLGILGLAPYWFEVDAALFLSDQGKLSSRIEVEYDLRFTQRLFLQPRLELNHAFSDDPAAGQWQGMQEGSVGLRLRYEFLREVAPYVGVEWWRSSGRTANERRRLGLSDEELRWVAGLRLWF
jgi:copper resistance protein B